ADLSKLTEEKAIELCKGCTAIVHSAGMVHKTNIEKTEYETLNVQATKLLYDAAAKCGVDKFVYLSSSSVYGNRSTQMLEESAELHGDTSYAESKIAAEEYLKANKQIKSTTILRPSLVFGERDRGNMLPLIRQVISGKYFIVGEGSARKSLIYAKDLARAVEMILKNSTDEFEIYNMANPEPVSVKQLSESILSVAGKNSGLISLPTLLVSSAAEIANIVLGKKSPLSADRLAKLTRENTVSVAKFQSKFNFKPDYNLANALAKEITWARKAGLL
ncbi:MAG: SDR family oxidoreductase, partial [Candidatus Obscuribacterales bacterium]|nr:SDR family oxidoreductase [Candidatus Obscuribacterales bacterium]